MDRSDGKIQLEYLAEGVKLTVMGGIYHIPCEEVAFPTPEMFHSHAWYELFYADSESLRISFPDEVRVINHGEMIIIEKGTSHYAQGHDHSTANISVEFKSHGSCAKRIARLFDFKKYRVIGVDSMATELFLSFRRAGDSGSSELAASLLFSLLLRLSELAYGEGFGVVCDGKMNRVYQIEQYLYASYRSSAPLSTLAEAMHLSCRQLSRIFKQLYGVSYTEKIISMRMELAARMLKDGEGISAVSDATGYKTPSAFHKTFKKYYGVSPSEYKGDQI